MRTPQYPKEVLQAAIEEVAAAGGGAYYAAETGKPYSLRNQALLALQGAPEGAYAAFHTARKLKRRVKKGTHGFQILFYGKRILKPEEATEELTDGLRQLAGALGIRARVSEAAWKVHTLFHVATQTEPLPVPEAALTQAQCAQTALGVAYDALKYAAEHAYNAAELLSFALESSQKGGVK